MKKQSPTFIDCTVVLTHYNRQKNLENTLEGLNMQSSLPKKVVVVNFGTEPELSVDYRFELSIIPFRNEWQFLPVAAARNLGVEHADTEHLVFLDVDCIPSRNFCGTIVGNVRNNGGLVMGTPRYMLVKKQQCHNLEQLENLSTPHPARPIVSNIQRENCYELFWSLCFCININDFKRIGGFDENYVGYGVEDTDFGLKSKQLGVPFYLSPAEVYHQQHPLFIPPLNHIESIIGNCNHFHSKWGYWPMSDCLEDFKYMGLIEWNFSRNRPISLLRLPDQHIIDKHLVQNAPYR
ncbi:hypothetical protein HME9304_00237 [Flagellimonas maritima]|uniref:Glycosyltransferase n=1 Tax=Flagellimonas maritima TaxID=1383885 RepID=A0A2Z4LNB4_9FLAO|nr:glycosyltransferase [Allomuricauda aurantiaca]AWX43250.1 hypothetical protein HME9304_00237 [Allomuricauda aurantiaca]